MICEDLDGTIAVSPTGYIHGDTVADMIGDQPAVDAIPIEFIKKYMDWESMEWDESHKYVVDRYRLSKTIQFILDEWKEKQGEWEEE